MCVCLYFVCAGQPKNDRCQLYSSYQENPTYKFSVETKENIVLALNEKNEAKLCQINPLFSCLDENSEINNCEDIDECIFISKINIT